MVQLTPQQKERVRLLVKALKSRKYRQGKYGLKQYDKKSKRSKLCCLGVACEVARLSGLELTVARARNGYTSYGGESGILPTSVRDWFGFDLSDPLLLNAEGQPFNASHLNDFAGYKFGQIASAFERTYLNENNNNNERDNTNNV